MRIFIILFLLALPCAAQTPSSSKPSLSLLIMAVEQKDDVAKRLQAITALADFGPEAEPALPHLLDALQSTNEDLRLNAAITLAKIGKAALPALGKLLDAQEVDTRFYTLWTIGWIGPDAQVLQPAVIKLMTDKNEGIRRKAAFALGQIAGDPQNTMAVLVKAFADESDDVRQAAGAALAKFGKPAVPSLVALLKHQDAKARQQAAQALGEIGADAKEAIRLLKDLMLAPDSDANAYAQVLAKLGKASLAALETGFNDARPNVQQASAQALAVLGADAVPVLVDALGSKHVTVRRLAAQTLWPMRIGDKMVVTALAYALNDADDQVRLLCIQGLGQLGPLAKPAAAKIKEALTDLNPNVRVQAYHLLSSFGEDVGTTFQKALTSKNDQVRINSACLMLQVNYQPHLALPVAVEALKHEDLGLRMQAAFTLAQRQQQTEKLLPIFIAGLKHASTGVRLQAIQGLSMMHSAGDAAAKVLAAALRDDDANIRQYAVNGLHSVPGTPAVLLPLLTKTYQEGDAGARGCVMQVCWRYGLPAKDLILQGLKDKATNVRQQALYALQNVQGNRAEMVPTLVALLQDKSSEENLRVQVSQMLRNLGPKALQAVPALKEAVKDPNPTVRMNVLILLAMAGGEGSDFLVKHYHAEKEASVRMSLMQNLVYSGQPKLALPLMKSALTDADRDVRQNAANLLNAFGQNSAETFELFTLALKDADPHIRARVAYLGNGYGSKGWGPLEEALKTTSDGDARLAILQSLFTTRYHSKTGLAPLAVCLMDTNPGVRQFACNLLANLGPDAASALPRLRELTQDANPTVQNSARLAVQRIAPK